MERACSLAGSSSSESDAVREEALRRAADARVVQLKAEEDERKKIQQQAATIASEWGEKDAAMAKKRADEAKKEES